MHIPEMLIGPIHRKQNKTKQPGTDWKSSKPEAFYLSLSLSAQYYRANAVNTKASYLRAQLVGSCQPSAVTSYQPNEVLCRVFKSSKLAVAMLTTVAVQNN